MFRRIIVGQDDSEQAVDATAFARALARVSGADITLVEVIPATPFPDGATLPPPESFEERAESRRERLGALARSLNVDHELASGGSPAEGLSRTAAHLEADLVVVGSCHRGTLGRILAGSVGRTLLAGAPCAVAVAPLGYADRADLEIRHIGVGYDGSPEARGAVDEAFELARIADGELDVIRVVEPLELSFGSAWAYPDPGVAQAALEQCRAQLSSLVDELPSGVRTEGRLVEGAVAPTLAQVAEDEALDVVFTGSRGHGQVRGVLAGSASAGLIRTARCPAVVLPRQAVRKDREEPASTHRSGMPVF